VEFEKSFTAELKASN